MSTNPPQPRLTTPGLRRYHPGDGWRIRCLVCDRTWRETDTPRHANVCWLVAFMDERDQLRKLLDVTSKDYWDGRREIAKLEAERDAYRTALEQLRNWFPNEVDAALSAASGVSK